MRAIPAAVAREFLTERAERKARRIAEQRRRTEEAEKQKVALPAGVPARDDMSPVEAMIAGDPEFSTPSDDFGPGWGSPTRELLDAELAKGQRYLARRRAEAAEKKRLADKMKDDLQ